MKFELLENIAEIISGQSPPSGTYNQNNDGLPFFQGKADFGEKFPIPRYWCKEPTKIAKPNDILLSVRAPVGPVNICDIESCIGRGLAAIRVNTEVDYEYVYYFLKENERQIAGLGVGSTFKAISQNEIRRLKIPIPEKREDQTRAATLLKNIEELIQKRKESIDLIESFLKSVFVDRFIKKSFPLVTLEQITNKITDGEHKKPDYKESGIPFISVMNISKGVLSFKNCKFISQEDHTKFNKRCNPEFEDILYTKVGAGYGKAVVNDSRMPFSLYVSVALIKPSRAKVDSYFLTAALNHPFVKRQADKSIKGAGVPDLHLTEIKSFNIPLPPLQAQLSFSKIVKKAELIKKRYFENLIELENLYKSLTQKVFKGQLKLDKIKFFYKEQKINGINEIVESKKADERVVDPSKKTSLPLKIFDKNKSYWAQRENPKSIHPIEFNKLEGEAILSQIFSKELSGFNFKEFENRLTEESIQFEYDELKEFIFEQLEEGKIIQFYANKDWMKSEFKNADQNKDDFSGEGNIWFLVNDKVKK